MTSAKTGSCCSGGLTGGSPSNVASTINPEPEQVLQPLSGPTANWAELPSSIWTSVFHILMSEQRQLVGFRHLLLVHEEHGFNEQVQLVMASSWIPVPYDYVLLLSPSLTS